MQSAKFLHPLSLAPNQPHPNPVSVTELTAQPDFPPVPLDEHSTFGLVELMLKNPDRVDRLMRDDSRLQELVTQFLAIALVGFTIFGIAATVMLNAADIWPKGVPAARWGNRSIVNLVLAYDLGLVAATGVCLPSFYFHGLLAGVKTSMLQVLTHAMRGQASSAVALVGILPIYVAVVLGIIVFRVSPEYTRLTLYGALTLPFVAGLWGVRSLYLGFLQLTDTLAPNLRCRRECLLRRLTLAWSAVYTAVAPLMVYTLWNHLPA
jgi:hypothetical protein